MRASGWTTCSTATVKSNGPMVQSMKVNTLPVKSTEKAFTAGMTDRGTMASGRRIRFGAWARTHGSTDASSRESGSIIIWMALASIPGKTADSTVANTKTTKSTDSESTHGQTDGLTRATGAEVSSTAWECTKYPASRQSSAYGRKASVLNGLSRINSTKFNRVV